MFPKMHNTPFDFDSFFYLFGLLLSLFFVRSHFIFFGIFIYTFDFSYYYEFFLGENLALAQHHLDAPNKRPIKQKRIIKLMDVKLVISICIHTISHHTLSYLFRNCSDNIREHYNYWSAQSHQWYQSIPNVQLQILDFYSNKKIVLKMGKFEIEQSKERKKKAKMILSNEFTPQISLIMSIQC